MREVLEPLARVPGVRCAVMVSADGVPIAVHGRDAGIPDEGEQSSLGTSAEDINAFAGLAAGWLNEIRRAVDPLTWDPPQRVVLRSARGTLILLSTRGAILTVLLDRGMAPEELRLPMEAASARLMRLLRRSELAEPPPATGGRRSPGTRRSPNPTRGLSPGSRRADEEGQSVHDTIPEASREL
jgi:predicted regulator of Ras-like GTPase activity (Roadblock/LC7/MglB family)